MKADLSTLIGAIPEKQIREILLKYAQIHDDIREEIFSSSELKAKKYDELAVSEWKRRIEDAIEEDLAGDTDDYYANKYVSWENTVEKLSEAVQNLRNRGLNQDCLDLINETEKSITDHSENEFETAEEGYEIYVEYDDSWKEEIEMLRCDAVFGSAELKENLFEEYCGRAADGDLVLEWLANFNTRQDKAVQMEVILSYLRKHRADLNDYSVSQYASAAFNLQMDLNPEKIEELFQEFKKSRELRERMIYFYEENGRVDCSIRLLTEDLKQGSLSSADSNRLITLYLKEGNKPAAEQELRRRLEYNLDVRLPILEQFYDLAGKKAIEEVSSVIIGGKYEDSLKIAACKETGRVKELKVLLTDRANHFHFDDWTYKHFLEDYIYPTDKFISKQDEAFIPDLLLTLVEKELLCPRKRQEYQKIASFLGYLCSGSSSRKAKAVQFASDLLQKYKRRSAMVEIFKEHGFTCR